MIIILLSTDEAENSEIFHSLNILNTKFVRKTATSRLVISYEDLKSIMKPFKEGKTIVENNFKEVTVHVYPKIRRNLRFNIFSLNYKVVKDGTVQGYKMEHENTNPDKKDILCICSFKLNGKIHKFEKVL